VGRKVRREDGYAGCKRAVASTVAVKSESPSYGTRASSISYTMHGTLSLCNGYVLSDK
jgi:hypothetical protein